uniref:BEACH domain-containing protein n=2 Tax=Clastoptera arizonana TaxID=38151 RepID=A0A1B6CYW9_9HEMI
MDPIKIINHELKIHEKYLKWSSKSDRVEALVHSSWLRLILNNWKVPDEFPLHKHLTNEEVNAWLRQREKFGPEWQHIIIKVLEKRDKTVIPLPRTKEGTKPEATLSYSQIMHYVGQTNYKNIWKEMYRKYLSGSMPVYEQKVHNNSKIQLSDCTTVLREVISRTFSCPVISIDGSTPQIEVEPRFQTHPNLLPCSIVLETDQYFLLLHCQENSTMYSLQDCVNYSPSVLAGSYAKPLFIIYQLLRLMRHLHDYGLALGDITLSDILISQDLWIQVLPHMEANIYDLPNSTENTKKQLKSEEITRETLNDVGNLCAAWMQGALSNFDYLTALNKLAGRRYGDPRSHHVFPWISDFTFNNGVNWRDFTKSKFRLNKGDRQLDLTYDLPVNCNAAQVPHHVSDVLSEITYYVYLARITPKPILCKYVRPQWVPAEYPSSIQRLQQWTPDECIPEFFTDPTVFKSIHPDLPDLEIPSWAASAQEFITKHRDALESSHVSERLHFWIDLTFGYKLSGLAAIKSKNVCLQLVDGHTKLTDIGVVQLFTQPHPHRIGPSVYWGITPPRIHHNRQKDCRKGMSDDDDMQSSGDEEESVTNTNKSTPRSSPLALTRLLSRSRNSLTTTNVAPSSPSSDISSSVSNNNERSTSVFYNSLPTISLPSDYNPVAGLIALENLHSFVHKTSQETYKGFQKSNYNEEAALKQVVAARRLQEMQVLGCLIVEMFLSVKLRAFGCSLKSVSFSQRLRICRTILQTNVTNKDIIPRCVRSLVILLLQISNENESISTFKYPTVTNFGIPPPSAHQLLQPNLTSNLLPLPNHFPIIYSMVKTLKIYSNVISELRKLRIEKYPDGNRGDKLTNFIEKLSEWKVKSIAKDLENLVEDYPSSSATISWIDLILPHIINMLSDPATSIVTAWHLFDPIARALGPNRSSSLLLEPLVRLYDCDNEKELIINENSQSRLKKRIKLYHRSFLLRLLIRFRMKVFLDNFIPLLIEGVGGYQDIETKDSSENEGIRVEMRENSGFLDSNEVEEATEFGGDNILSPLDEDSSADSDKNPIILVPNEEQEVLMAEPELFLIETEESAEEDDSEQKHCKSIQNLLDQLEIQSDEMDDTTMNKSPVIYDVSWKNKSDDSLNYQNEEKGKIVDVEYSKVSEVSVDSVIWLMHRLGPVLSARYLSRNLLRMLSLCYTGRRNQQVVNNEFSKLGGDENATKVLECLGSIAVVFGEQFIVLQYLPYMTDLILLCKKKCTVNLEAGLIASLTLLKLCIHYITEATISDLLQETLLKGIIHPCLRLLASCKLIFPGGFTARQALAIKLIICLHILVLRVNTEQRIILVHTLQRFFLVFSKARGQKNEDVAMNRVSGEVVGVPRVRDYDSTDSSSPPPSTLKAKSDADNSKSKALEELCQVMSPQFAYWAYSPFSNFFGESFMEQSLKNHKLIKDLCQEFKKEQEILGKQVLENPFSLDSETNIHTSNEATAVIVGNRIDLQEPTTTKPGSPIFSCSPSRHLSNKNIENNSRHLRGNWLAYWEHEIGLNGKDGHLNIKQIKLQTFNGHSNSVRVLTVLDNENSFLSASKDKTVKVWSLRSKGDGNTLSPCQWTYTGHRKSVMALGFVERVRLAVSCDSTVHLWDPFVGRVVTQIDMFKGSPVNTLRPLHPPSAAVLTANTDATLRTFDARLGTYVNELKVVASAAGLIRCISISPEGNLVVLGQASGYLTILDLRTGLALSSWKGHEGEILQLSTVSEQTVVSSSLDQSVSAWSINDGKLKFNLKGPTEPVHCLDTYCNELISGTTANRIGVHSGIECTASFSSTRLRSDAFKGVLTSLTVLPLNRLLLLGADTGNISLLC